jgi:hypothetical protein
MTQYLDLVTALVCQGMPLADAEHAAYVKMLGYDPRAEIIEE